jgi:hypothetical protein
MNSTSDIFASKLAQPHLLAGQAVRGLMICPNCQHSYPQDAKFCGDCGASAAGATLPTKHLEHAPNFAHVKANAEIPKELSEELGGTIVLLARERIFLYMHCLLFLAINLFGFWLSMKIYNGYDCDELTRGVISLTPLFYINSVALVCLVPIKGTKREIGRLKERITFLRYRIEYRNLL